MKKILFLTMAFLTIISLESFETGSADDVNNTELFASDVSANVDAIATTTDAVYEVTATMYNPTVSQCDADPLTTAGMYEINPDNASEHKWVALSRDLLTRWGGDFDYGDIIRISGTGEKDGEYLVADTMNKRYTNRIDILETEGVPLYKFEKARITKV